MTIIYFVILNLMIINNLINAQTVTVNIDNGQVNGQQLIVMGKTINRFLGIPYAKPPIGDLRFRRPVKPDNEDVLIDATEWPNSCIQAPNQVLFGDFNFSIYRNTSFSEDCLYLNVWSPFDNITEVSDTQLKAVILWIHGGSFADGSSSLFIYDGEWLSALGDVIVVTFNYRLNVFGFFYAGTDDAPGNVGLWDQALALEWVYDNIRNFGGDPNRTTIVGESAGALSLSLLLLSPNVSQNWYQNAALMSGVIINNLFTFNTTQSTTKWLTSSKTIGCADNTTTEFDDEIIECLRNISANTLFNVIGSGRAVGYLVEEGEMVVQNSLEALESGSFKQNLNLLIGTCEDEGSYLLSTFNPVNLTYNDAVSAMVNTFKPRFFNQPVNSLDMTNVYFNEISKTTASYDELRTTIGIALGDYILTCPTYLFAKILYDNARNGSHVYQYQYRSRLGEGEIFCDDWMGACHGNDIWPLFGMPFILYDDSSDEDRAESLMFIDFFANFAKEGKPSPQYNIDWPQYYIVNDIVVASYFEFNGLNNSQFKNQLKCVECDILYKPYILIQ